MKAESTITTPEVRRLIDWDNPIAIADGFSSARGQAPGETLGQFALFTPYITSNGVWVNDWSSNQNSMPITKEQMQRIAALQDTTRGYTLKQIMGWLTFGGKDKWGGPMRCVGEWSDAINARMIAAVYAGGLVEVLEHKTIVTDKYGTVPMVRIKTGWDQVHLIRAVDKANDMIKVQNDSVYLPLLAGRWTNAEWWLLDRWLV